MKNLFDTEGMCKYCLFLVLSSLASVLDQGSDILHTATTILCVIRSCTGSGTVRACLCELDRRNSEGKVQWSRFPQLCGSAINRQSSVVIVHVPSLTHLTPQDQ